MFYHVAQMNARGFKIACLAFFPSDNLHILITVFATHIRDRA